MKLDKTSARKILKIVWIVYALMSVLFCIPEVDRMLTMDYKALSQFVSLDDSWNITVNEEVYPNVSLADFHVQGLKSGDRITMTRPLPSDWGLVEGALRFYVRHSAVRMFVDDTRIFEYGYERLANKKTLGSGYQFVKFPNEYQGKSLRIELCLAEDNVFTKFDSVRIYEWENAYRVLITENRLPLFCGSFLVIFGLIVCVITIFALVFSRKYIRLFCISLFSICMGLWTLCYYNIMQIFAVPLYSISLINYLTLYLAPIPLTVYLYEEVVNLKNKLLKRIYFIFLSVELVGVSVMIGLHTADLVHMAATLKYMQFILVGGLVFFFVVLLMNLRYSKIANRLSVVGMLVITCCMVYDMFGYNLGRYFGSDIFNLKGVSSGGIMIFICMLFITFYVEMTQKMMQEKERDFLIKSAYTDELTQLHNRRYCMEYMNRLKEEKDFKYTVVCFDLNNLKAMNDTYGHAKGDILIKSAADVIAKTFEEHGIVARMGGDEFVAVLRTSDQAEITAMMEQFSENLARKNQDAADLNMSIAYGYACGSQTDRDIEKIYQIADDRMYEKKKQMKSRMKSAGIQTGQVRF